MLIMSLRVLIIFLVAGMYFNCTLNAQSADSEETSIRIYDVINGKEAPDPGTPKAGDVIIQRTIFLGKGYMVVFYPEKYGRIREYSVFRESNDIYDTAYYKWIGEGEVSIRLVNSESEKEIAFVAYGIGNTTGIRE